MGPKLLFCQMSWNSNDWIVRNQQVCAKAIGLNFSSYCACFLLGSFDLEKSENCWVLCVVTFSNIPLLYKTKAINTLRSITKKNSKDRADIEQIKWSLYQRHVSFCNPCARAESHQQERARKLCSATLREFFQFSHYKTVIKQPLSGNGIMGKQ